MKDKIAISNKTILNKIYVIRNQKIMLDKDLAALFGVENKQLKRQVRRNIARFPKHFMFEITKEEYDSLKSQFGTLKRGRHSKYPPFAFTEHGVLMLSSVLNSKIAIEMSIQIMDTFVQLRKFANTNKEISLKIKQLETQYKEQFSEIYSVLQNIIDNPINETPRTKIGYKK